MKFEFSGMCSPEKTQQIYNTFSVGIYPMMPKTNGKGLKKGKTVVRVSGRSENPELVYAKAKEIAELLEKNEYTGPKYVKLK